METTATKKTLTPEEHVANEKARALQTQLAAIELKTVPVQTSDRGIPRKQQAKLARALLKQLGLRGISVTTPNYSMAQAVHVRIPGRLDYDVEPWGTAVSGCEAIVANNAAERRVEEILLAAFPKHDNRSNSAPDYFDYCWSVNCVRD